MRRLLGLVPLLILLGMATHVCVQEGLHPGDDGYTALRVAENFRSGAGIGFNAGEKRDLVTSPLWLAMLSLLSFSSQADLGLLLLGLFLGTLTLLVMLIGSRDALVGTGAALFVALDGLYVSRIASGGCEPLVGLYLVCLVLILRLGKARGEAELSLALWAAAAGFVRYELLLVAFPVALGAALREPRRRLAWLPLVAAMLGASLFAGLHGFYFPERPAAWEPWPPTMQDVVDAAHVVLWLLLRRPLLVLGLALLVSEWVHGRLWLGRRVGLAWGLLALLAWSLFPAQGQDVERFVAPLLPLLAFLAVEAIWRRARTRPALVAALLLVLAQPNWTIPGRRTEPGVDAEYARLGRWLSTHAAPEITVGAARVGALGYQSGLRVEDARGRVSARVAAARRVASRANQDRDSAFQLVFKLEPDLIIVLPGDPVPSARTYVPADQSVPEAIRGPFRVYRWAGSSVWRREGSARG